MIQRLIGNLLGRCRGQHFEKFRFGFPGRQFFCATLYICAWRSFAFIRRILVTGLMPTSPQVERTYTTVKLRASGPLLVHLVNDEKNVAFGTLMKFKQPWNQLLPIVLRDGAANRHDHLVSNDDHCSRHDVIQILPLLHETWTYFDRNLTQINKLKKKTNRLRFSIANWRSNCS